MRTKFRREVSRPGKDFVKDEASVLSRVVTARRVEGEGNRS